MKFFLRVPFALLISCLATRAADFAEPLKEKKASAGPEEVQAFIKESYEANKEDPAYYVASANYWWNLAQEPNLSTKPSEKGDFVLADPKTGREVGSMSTMGRVNPEIPQKAIAVLTEGCRRFPNRVDMSMGLAYMQRAENKQKECAATLQEMLVNAGKNPGELHWKNGEAFKEPPGKFIPELLQGYTAGFYNLETKEGDELCRALCEAIIRTYPDHPYAYNMLAALRGAQKDDKGSIKYLLLAYERAPKDNLILLNLADAYRRTADKAAALKYYKLVLANSPPDDLKADAQAAINELGK